MYKFLNVSIITFLYGILLPMMDINGMKKMPLLHHDIIRFLQKCFVTNYCVTLSPLNNCNKIGEKIFYVHYKQGHFKFFFSFVSLKEIYLTPWIRN